MEQEPPRSRRDIGVRLASVLRGREGQDLSASSLQGIAADVVAGDEKLILPIRYLISLPIFRQLIPKAGSGTGLAERDAILQDIQETFSPRIAKAVGEVLSGFLGLPDFPVPTSLPTHVASNLGQVVDQRPPAILLPSQPLCEEAGTIHSSPSRSSARKVLLPAAALLALCTGIILSVKVPPFCTSLGLCAPVASASSKIALQTAKQAADRLEAAKDLGSFQQASLALDAALLKLSGVELLPEQRTALQNLLTVASAARRRAGQELADRERLLRVREVIASAREADEKSMPQHTNYRICTILDPADTYANKRMSPNGKIESTIANGEEVVLLGHRLDSDGRTWGYVLERGVSGYVFGDFLSNCRAK